MDRRQRLLSRLPLIAGIAVMAVVIVLGVLIARSFLDKKGNGATRKIQVVQVIRPPPPPPPPEDRPPPPPETQREKIEEQEPEPTPSDSPAPSEQLGLDTEGTAGGDAFGLAAHKGGHDITGTGGAIFGWYTGRVKDVVADRLSNDARIRSRRFAVSVKVWIAHDGEVREAKLASTTGDHALDAAIEAALAHLQRINEPPPLEMPQPITLKIVSRS